MALVEMIMPKMGESIMEGTILSWLKNIGDTIEQDEFVVEVATDKVESEVPASHGGVLKEILAHEGDVIEVGKPIAMILVATENTSPKKTVTQVASTISQAVTTTAPIVAIEKPTSGRFYSPLVLNIAREENIPMTVLETVLGTGKENRVTKKDILAFVKNKSANGVEAATPAFANAQPQPTQQPVTVSGDDEIIAMNRMRKMIAQRMVDSTQISAHVTSFVEADVTKMVRWRGKYKKIFMERERQALTFTPMFIEAVVLAIRDYPMLNVQVDGDNIIKKGAINVGMAVALPSGNLIVPVIHNADQLNLKGLAFKVNDLAKRSRDNKLKPDDLQGGTYTISNVGSFGNVMGTPIILQPQVGILAVGAIVKKPSVIETAEGDTIGIRHKMFLSHSYDHRVIDGALGGMFVRRVADYLEKFDVDQTI